MNPHVCPLDDALKTFVCTVPLLSVLAARDWDEAKTLLRAELEKRGLPTKPCRLFIFQADEPGIMVWDHERNRWEEEASTEEGP